MDVFMLNPLEWILLITAIMLIVILMNMFPICRWIAQKTTASCDAKSEHRE